MDLAAVVEHTSNIILGKDQIIRKCLCCILARGHILIEDVPGVGKTTLAQAIAKMLGLQLNRIQFTSDLLPADITGAAIYSQATQTFDLHKGPIFSEFVLADEINRASPKTQSALLEAMEEQQVTIEGTTYRLPSPFFVIATQNPIQQTGTYPLPESQLDRFLMRLHIGYPDKRAETNLLMGDNPRTRIDKLNSIHSPESIIALQNAVDKVHVSDSLASYVQRLLQYSRECGEFTYGLSPRTGMNLVQVARAWAAFDDRKAVLPDDIQAVFGDVVNHRLQWRTGHRASENPAEHILQATPIVG